MSSELSVQPASSAIRAGDSDALPIEHLQLRSMVTAALRQYGVTAVGDASAFLLEMDTGQFAHGAELAEAVCQLECCRTDGEIDWRRYWQARSFRFNHLCASLPGLDRLNDRARTHPVDRRSLGLAGMRLSGCGYSELGTLVDALRSGIPLPAGVGTTKLQDFFERLVDLSDSVDEFGSLPFAPYETAHPAAAESVPAIADLPGCVSGLPVDVLCVGVKCRLLRRAGYRSIDDLLSVDPAVLGRVPAVGPGTVSLIIERIEHLRSSVRDGEVDWAGWCELAGIPLIPGSVPVSGRELAAALPGILIEIAARTGDPVVADIVVMRLLPVPHERGSLDEIAARNPRSNGRKVSRQRVQQMESHLLRQLAAALVRGRDEGLGICFHPEFTTWWRLAADEFSGTDEITVDDFFHRLASAWGITVAELVPCVPAICAIVTGDTRMPAELRHAVRVPPSLYRIGPAAMATPIRLLRLGRRIAQLENEGCTALGGLVDLAREGRCPGDVLEHLDLLAGCLEDGKLCWSRYRTALGLPTIPDPSPASPAGFVSSLAATVRSVLDLAQPTARSTEIFWRRTRFPDRQRPTLEQVATELGTRGSSVKREETELLELLHSLLVEKKFGSHAFWIDCDWLAHVQEAHGVFANCQDDFDRFGAALAVRWNLNFRDIADAQPVLWAIFTGYPAGRRRSVTPRTQSSHQVHQPVRIRLRGFRTTH